MDTRASRSGSHDRHASILLSETSIEADRHLEHKFVKLLKAFSKSNSDVDRGVMQRVPMVIAEALKKPTEEVLYRIIQLCDKFVNFKRFLCDYDVSYVSENNRVTPGYSYIKAYRSNKEMDAGIYLFRKYELPYYRKLRFIFVIAQAALLDEEPEEYKADDIPERDSDIEYFPELESDDDEELVAFDPDDDEMEEEDEEDDNDEEEDEEADSDDDGTGSIWKKC